MFIIIGIVVVIASVVGGYLMEGGKLLVLNQPAEFVIIGGAALGSLLIGTPPTVLKRLLGQMAALFGAGPSKDDYSELLAMLYQLFKTVAAVRRHGARAALREPARERDPLEVSEVPRRATTPSTSSPTRSRSSSSAASARTTSKR